YHSFVLPDQAYELPRRAYLLPKLVEVSRLRGFIERADIEQIARELRMPIAEAWEAATSQHELRFFEPSSSVPGCAGVACAVHES
ncbi:MAG: hypothetical protein C4321_00310, partial [Chloroflexota bacterium]